MTDTNKDNLLYRPHAEPYRHYESEADFKHENIIPPENTNKEQEEPPLSEDIEELRDMVDFLPDGLFFIKDTIDKILTRQKIIETNPPTNPVNPTIPDAPNLPDIKPPNKNDSKHNTDTTPTPDISPVPNPEPYNPAKPQEPTTPTKPTEPTDKDIDYIDPSIDFNDPKIQKLPDLFPAPTDITINFTVPKTLVQIIQEDYQKDTVDLHQYYLQKLQVIMQQYFQEMLTIMQECGVGNIEDLLKSFDGDVVTIPNSDLAHLRDYIVRSQIVREQKNRYFKKTHNLDYTLTHMRAWHTAEQERERYYTENYGDSNTYLNGHSNSLLRESRSSYDKKYIQTLYNMYKYLDSSALLVGDILNMTVKEAQAKGKLLKEGVDIFVSKETQRQQEINNQINEYEMSIKKQEAEASKNSSTSTDNKTDSSSNSTTSTSNQDNDSSTAISDNTLEENTEEVKEENVKQTQEVETQSKNIIENMLNTINSTTPNNIFTVGGGILGNTNKK